MIENLLTKILGDNLAPIMCWLGALLLFFWGIVMIVKFVIY